MPEPQQQEKQSALKRYALIKLMFGLAPLLAAVGFLAPGWVQLMAVAQVEEEAARGEIVDRIGPYGRRPLLVPRDFSAGFIPELLDLDQLFLGSRASEPSDGPVVRISGFDRSYGELIAFDDFGVADSEVEFKDVLMEEPLAALAPANADDDLGLPLCGTLYAGNCVRDDDFSGNFVIETDPQPIPEPGTAALMVLGMLGLAWQGRRARRRAQRR